MRDQINLDHNQGRSSPSHVNTTHATTLSTITSHINSIDLEKLDNLEIHSVSSADLHTDDSHTHSETSSSTDSLSFEGPEKRLEVVFKPDLVTDNGFRKFEREVWDELLEHAKCTIISCSQNADWDAYILSESSLFVSANSIVLKTCGTTVLLQVIPSLMELAAQLGTEVEFVAFSHKNFNFSDLQLFPHKAFSQEVEFLNHFFAGEAFVLGPITGDHFFMYVADYTDRVVPLCERDQILEILMSELDLGAMNNFFMPTNDTKRKFLNGISQLVPGMSVDEHLFNPCGYSMNGFINGAYVTIHVTPEPEHSYVSFETNYKIPNYDRIIQSVFDYFKPGRATVTTLADDGCLERTESNPVKEFQGYKRTSQSVYRFAEDYRCELLNYVSATYSYGNGKGK